MADESPAVWPLATDADFKRACAELRIDPNWDTGKMGTFAALARLQERILSLERRLAEHDAKYGPRQHGAED